MRKLLILDDDARRLEEFSEAAKQLGADVDVRSWRSAPPMIAELDQVLPDAKLISLDHNLYKVADKDPDPGTGRDVANILAKRAPVCPIIVHTSNTDQAWGMYNELTHSGWPVEIVHQYNQPRWIADVWLPVASLLLASSPIIRPSVGDASAAQKEIYKQVAVIPFRRKSGSVRLRGHTCANFEILLITSHSDKHWIIPKGGIGPGQTPAEAARAEAWEEAGVRGGLSKLPVASYQYEKWGGICEVSVFLMEVKSEHEPWPEQAERQRRWLSPQDALEVVHSPKLRSLIAHVPELLSLSVQGDGPKCTCFLDDAEFRDPEVHLHSEVQDTSSDAWKRLLDFIEETAAARRETFNPSGALNPEEWHSIVTLPASIGKLKSVTHVHLYGSSLVRIPPEIGEMESLQDFDPYTSYRLHWLPYEITRCPNLRKSRISTRALYGNNKYRPPFPDLRAEPNATTLRLLRPQGCSVCGKPFADRTYPVWITLRVATDFVPLLAFLCSKRCVAALPPTPKGFVWGPHQGGGAIQQT